MKLSQIGTKFCTVMTATLLITSQFAMAGDRTELNRENMEFLQRLKQVYSDKNRPFPAFSTGELPYKTDKVPKILKENRSAVKMGGVSDGGGNAVGVTLFDFYENEGSLEISVDELVHIEPKAEQIINFLNNQIPAVGSLSSGGFGDILKNSLRTKKIYLESKEISSEACKNQSMVASEQQTVVACQSDTELRLSVQWLRSTDASNRAGLITHELTLGWTRDRMRSDDKAGLEQSVRETNREIFNAFSGRGDFSKNLAEKTNLKVYDKNHFEKARVLSAKIYSATTMFCEDPKTDVESLFQDYISDSFFAGDLGFVKSMNKVSNEARKGAPAEAVDAAKSNLCEDYIIDKTPVHEPNMDILPENCVSHARESARHLIEISANSKDGSMNEDLIAYFTVGSLSMVKSSANLCSGLRGIQLEKKLFMTEEKGHRMMRETYFEAINYVRYLVKQEGVDLKFFKKE